MEVLNVKRLKSLEAERARRKHLHTESLPAKEVTREALRKNRNPNGPSGHGAVDATKNKKGWQETLPAAYIYYSQMMS